MKFRSSDQMTMGHKSWGKLLGEAVLDVVLLVLDHLTLFLVWVPGFKPLFLLQVPVLILDFDFFPTFLSWVDICYTAQWFHLRWLSAYSILVIPRLFLLFISTPTSQYSTESCFFLLAAVSFRDCCGLSHWTSFIPAAGVTSQVPLSRGGRTGSRF